MTGSVKPPSPHEALIPAPAFERKALRAFLRQLNVPLLWLAHGMWPEALWKRLAPQLERDEPKEHLRWGAFMWWLEQGEATEERLTRLVDLIAIDPDPCMAAAAAQQLLGHPLATEFHAQRLQTLTAHNAGWQHWTRGEPDFFVTRLADIHAERARRQARNNQLARIRADAHQTPHQIQADELQAAYAQDEPDLMLALIEHPLLPLEQLQALAEWRDRPLAKTVRNAAAQAIAKRERVQAQSPASD